MVTAKRNDAVGLGERARLRRGGPRPRGPLGRTTVVHYLVGPGRWCSARGRAEPQPGRLGSPTQQTASFRPSVSPPLPILMDLVIAIVGWNTEGLPCSAWLHPNHPPGRPPTQREGQRTVPPLGINLYWNPAE